MEKQQFETLKRRFSERWQTVAASLFFVPVWFLLESAGGWLVVSAIAWTFGVLVLFGGLALSASEQERTSGQRGNR